VRLVAHFKGGAFGSVTEGLMIDDSGNYFVGGELPLPVDRVKDMDKAGEIEWAGTNLLVGGSDSVAQREPAREFVADAAEKEQERGEGKKALLIAAVIVAAVVAIVGAVIWNAATQLWEDAAPQTENIQQEVPTAVDVAPEDSAQQDEPIDTTPPTDDISDAATQEEVSQEQIAFEDMSDAEFVAYWLGESDIENITDILVNFEVAMTMPDGWSAVEQDFLQLPSDFQRLMYDVFSVWIEHISVGSVAHEDIGRVLGDEAVQFVITMENTIGFW